MAIKWQNGNASTRLWGTNAERIAMTDMPAGAKFKTSDTLKKYEYTGSAWILDEEEINLNTSTAEIGNVTNSGTFAVQATVVANQIASGRTIELQVPFAKNTLADVETVPVQIPKPASPLSSYKLAVKNPSIDTAITLRLFNRRTFTEIGVGFAAGSDATHVQLSAFANPTDDYYNTFVITITGGTGAGQTRTISDYVGNTQIATVSTAWVTALDDDSSYSIAMVTDSLAYSGSFAKASLTAPVALATDSALITGLFDNGCNVYCVFSNDDAIPAADASRFTAIMQLIPVL